MSADSPEPPLPAKNDFAIDHQQLGVVLAEAFILRVSAFESPQRVLLLRACRARLAQEGGEIRTHLLQLP